VFDFFFERQRRENVPAFLVFRWLDFGVAVMAMANNLEFQICKRRDW